MANKLSEKHHLFLSEELLSLDYASRRLDPEGAWHALVRIVAQAQGPHDPHIDNAEVKERRPAAP